MFSKSLKSRMPNPGEALPGRAQPLQVPATHHVTGGPLAPTDASLAQAMFGMGCFWGAEKMFWQTPGVVSTNVGYAGGHTPNPTYEEVCSGGTGHTEVVRVFFDPARVSYEELLRVFWEGHDPTQGMRQGNDVGTQYRSAAYYFDEEQRAAIEASARCVSGASCAPRATGRSRTEILPAPEFYFAEGYHQQYLAKNPGGYCGHGGTGVSCPIGLAVAR